MNIVSFGHKNRSAPIYGHYIDARTLPNPYRIRDLKPLTGLDPAVQAYVRDTDPDAFADLVTPVLTMHPLPEAIVVGCYGGKHRSVAVAEMLARTFRTGGVAVTVTHLELPTSKK